jgi:glycosyltransferase involved in cell wall biosynthesis
MNILFLTLVSIADINERNIYADLMRKFRNEGHDVYILTPLERRFKQNTILITTERTNILRLKTLNIQKTNVIEKGISTLMIEYLYLSAIKKYFPQVKFDLVIYSTPPITFSKVIRYIKKKCGAKSYLLLKDIFPQNAVDLGMIKKGGLIHRYFRHKEKQLYHVSDFIGCMSTANVDYVIRHNPEINPEIVEVNPNSVEPDSHLISKNEKQTIRDRYEIPSEAIVFIYGGNLGRPQGIDFLLDVLKSNMGRKDIFFVIVGNGTEYIKVQSWFLVNNPNNAKLIGGLPKNEYDRLIQSCNVGLIFLDKRFTIPNFPSRLLSYMEYKKPIIAATDKNTDLGSILEENGFGFWCESGDLEKFNHHIMLISQNRITLNHMASNSYSFLINNYTVSASYSIILSRLTC